MSECRRREQEARTHRRANRAFCGVDRTRCRIRGALGVSATCAGSAAGCEEEAWIQISNRSVHLARLEQDASPSPRRSRSAHRRVSLDLTGLLQRREVTTCTSLLIVSQSLVSLSGPTDKRQVDQGERRRHTRRWLRNCSLRPLWRALGRHWLRSGSLCG